MLSKDSFGTTAVGDRPNPSNFIKDFIYPAAELLDFQVRLFILNIYIRNSKIYII